MKQLTILFLDDDIQRHHAIQRHLVGHDVTYVFTADAAINALKQRYFDVVFLDHDLRPEHYGMTDFDLETTPGAKPFPPLELDDTGYKVAHALVHNADAKRKESMVAVIHTMNERGARRMMHVLRWKMKLIRWVFNGNDNPLRLGPFEVLF